LPIPPPYYTSFTNNNYSILRKTPSRIPPLALFERPMKKKCRILPAGGLGVSPRFKISPKIGGYRGLIETIPAISLKYVSI
jgi:hypothetical protein